MRVFISYSHKQGDWVIGRLVPVLVAAGAEVLIDRERFKLGKAVVGQMDALQDQAERHLLVLSPEYLASDYCQHEMIRAVAKDPGFKDGLVLPVIRAACDLPDPFTGWNPPLYAKFENDSQMESWDALLSAFEADGLGCGAPDWLSARDEIRKYLERNQSVNLVVNGSRANWRGLLDHLATDCFPDLARVDLQNGETASRPGLLATIAKAMGSSIKISPKPRDLAEFNRLFDNRPPVRLCLSHFDLVPHREHYDVDLFGNLRYLSMETRQLVLLVQSRTPFGALLPKVNPLSAMNLKTVELQGRP